MNFVFFHYGGIPSYLRASIESVRVFNPEASGGRGQTLGKGLLAGIHMGIHRKQIAAILERVV